MNTEDATPGEVRSSDQLGLQPERAAFERWAAVNGYHLRRDEGNPERYHAWVTNTLWIGWQAGAAAERKRCHQWSEAEAVAAAHGAGFAGTHWTMGPEELVHLLNMVHARPNESR